MVIQEKYMHVWTMLDPEQVVVWSGWHFSLFPGAVFNS